MYERWKDLKIISNLDSKRKKILFECYCNITTGCPNEKENVQE